MENDRAMGLGGGGAVKQHRTVTAGPFYAVFCRPANMWRTVPSRRSRCRRQQPHRWHHPKVSWASTETPGCPDRSRAPTTANGFHSG